MRLSLVARVTHRRQSRFFEQVYIAAGAQVLDQGGRIFMIEYGDVQCTHLTVDRDGCFTPGVDALQRGMVQRLHQFNYRPKAGRFVAVKVTGETELAAVNNYLHGEPCRAH
ncbi:hypothetical protein ACFPTO_03995 [Paraburkholderia denitrificans]|uniref:Uncharacterized protein n=1 Tax=Paraburkholderia denitrificans TaxID=694025 RepID=A0ABW0J4J9_9BURK